MAILKKISVLSVFLFTACQSAADSNLNSIVVYDEPASDAAESFDASRLPAGFPLIAEMGISVSPKPCALRKVDGNLDGRYVFASQDDDLYNVGVNGTVRSFKPSGAADMDGKIVRYFKTVDAPEVEIMVVLEPEDSPHKSIVGRIKAWDQDLPLMCAYNRIEVQGDCEL